MICKKCGYKLTELFTSYACDRCDGLVAKPEPSSIFGWMILNKSFTPGPSLRYWMFANETGADQQLTSFGRDCHKVAVNLNAKPTKITTHPIYGEIFTVHKLQKTDVGWTAEVVE